LMISTWKLFMRPYPLRAGAHPVDDAQFDTNGRKTIRLLLNYRCCIRAIKREVALMQPSHKL
jgi:hypothetical protein